MDGNGASLSQTSGIVVKNPKQSELAKVITGCILSPLLTKQEQIVYQNKEKVSSRHRYIANINMTHLTDTNEISPGLLGYRMKAYVFHTPLPNGEVRAVISKSAEDTINILNYACESELFDFGDVDKKEFYAWKDNELYTDRDGFKFMPWNVFSKIKDTYKTLRSKFRYTHNLKEVKLQFTDFEGQEKSVNGIIGMKFAFFVPINGK
ncbi:hypothetical protein CYMTET_42767 [Cymbomonas tetramitiformis]|uniref:Uncharacterized protein n=1 Tax=Cymbomonas tetramitiformis TaxID=36881 RepID=A0AAE0F169_9CHLO|nr:hypothetical protein CYMTET_42767 [Cymbomonas tetramitiformis]